MVLWNAIDTGGVFERYGRARRRYLYPGDGRKYWHMGPLYQSRVLNRMRIEDDLERLRLEGQTAAVEYGVARLAQRDAWIDGKTGERVAGEITPAPEVPPA